jgi:hypothetical protein
MRPGEWQLARRRRRRSSEHGVPQLRVAGQFVSHDTIAALESLLARARDGEIIGLAYVALARQKNYVVDTAGEARRDPTFALGMVQILRRLIEDKITPP